MVVFLRMLAFGAFHYRTCLKNPTRRSRNHILKKTNRMDRIRPSPFCEQKRWGATGWVWWKYVIFQINFACGRVQRPNDAGQFAAVCLHLVNPAHPVHPVIFSCDSKRYLMHNFSRIVCGHVGLFFCQIQLRFQDKGTAQHIMAM